MKIVQKNKKGAYMEDYKDYLVKSGEMFSTHGERVWDYTRRKEIKKIEKIAKLTEELQEFKKYSGKLRKKLKENNKISKNEPSMIEGIPNEFIKHDQK